MAALTVWRFDSADGGQSEPEMLERLQLQELIQVNDAAVVTSPVRGPRGFPSRRACLHRK